MAGRRVGLHLDWLPCESQVHQVVVILNPVVQLNLMVTHVLRRTVVRNMVTHGPCESIARRDQREAGVGKKADQSSPLFRRSSI
jgi:hypothetical protein